MKRDYLEFMTADLPMQFRTTECHNNRVLLKALAKQLDDVFELFNQLEKRTYLRLISDNETGESLADGAHGIHLDRIGEIVDLTRKQATVVSSKIETINDLEKSSNITDDTLIGFIRDNFTTFYPNDSLGDSEYSEYLFYKIFLNSSHCTYEDVIKSLNMFWKKSPIYYSEKPEEPATIFLSTPDLKPEQDARLFFLAPVVKAAGVRLFREAATVAETANADLNVACGMFNGVLQTELPYLVIEHKYDKTVEMPTRLENIVISEPSYDDIFDFFTNNRYYQAVLKKSEYNKHSVVVFPAFYAGRTVNYVSMPSFEGEELEGDENMITELVFPSTVRRIGKFSGLKALKSLNLPKGINTLDAGAFSECTSLETVVFSPHAAVRNIPANCFAECSSLSEIVLPNYINIGQNAFYGCNNLKKVVFNGTLKKWNKVIVASGNECLENAEIECLGGLG